MIRSFILPPSSIDKPDLRGFEWHYYQAPAGTAVPTFSRGTTCLGGRRGFQPQNGQLVTLDQNGQVRRWGLEFAGTKMKQSRRDLPGGTAAQVRILSPDGRLAALAEENTVHVFDATTGKEIFPDRFSPIVRFASLIFHGPANRLVIVDDKIRWCRAVSGEVTRIHSTRNSIASRASPYLLTV